MNEIVNKFLLEGDRFMPEMHLRQPTAFSKWGFTYRAWGPFTKSIERIQKLKETGDSRYIYQNELDKSCFEHNVPYGDFKNFHRRAASDKILCDKAFTIAKQLKYNGYQKSLTLMVYKFINEILCATRAQSDNLATQNKFASGDIKNEIMSNQELGKELHKPVVKRLKKRKVHSFFIDNIWDAYIYILPICI